MPAPELDKVIHERARLGIMSALVARESMTFTEVKATLGLTDGNLSVHARVLESAGYLKVKKQFVKEKPQTTLSLTAEGRAAFAKYLDALEEIVMQAKKGGGKSER